MPPFRVDKRSGLLLPERTIQLPTLKKLTTWYTSSGLQQPTAEPTGSTFFGQWTLSADQFPKMPEGFTGQYYFYICVATTKQTATTAISYYSRLRLNGVTVSGNQTGDSKTGQNYYTYHMTAKDVKPGDVVDLRLWASASTVYTAFFGIAIGIDFLRPLNPDTILMDVHLWGTKEPDTPFLGTSGLADTSQVVNTSYTNCRIYDQDYATQALAVQSTAPYDQFDFKWTMWKPGPQYGMVRHMTGDKSPTYKMIASSTVPVSLIADPKYVNINFREFRPW